MPEKSRERNETLNLKRGHNAVFLPDLGGRDTWDDPKPVSAEETMQKLQAFLDEIDAQGGRIVGIIDVTIDKPTPGVVGGTDAMKLAIILKD
ncbi:hypothetical protein A3A84_03315 [Candidatus Collierbacteria bacterium RIFCSPLOWO2_01_FULL_50_23]|uniref:Uncharacterized protein n=2 Tax=Candidatus Collieribacteriota TaxID=1752725 RepID=A0A1F5EXQ5_9BACT|nr:MAG: hypothetical protein A3D09_00275 [Candidatus Collierbacteria bacterium RIFCSPHIGHO2_02_FULL_49_10]OGD72141.1 MAG: hypothetical protein A2703_02890 [Candidatus Collierbacteria bacterium RIFCSPHIGHO2_01_FULL_50_25]OGD75074.1 MAG: hypothetical protein A3A84_03315 [Candidatus Collierbacteria bacterium RIFCSPLOWO2_01_FULL_50_23]